MLKDFGNFAVKLSRNPLGIIALSLVLVYGITGLVATSSNFQDNERYILVWFLVLFPLLVLAIFYNLVTRHHTKLYSPSDFTNEDNFIRLVEQKLQEKVDVLKVQLAKSIKEQFDTSMRSLDLDIENSILKLNQEYIQKIEKAQKNPGLEIENEK